MKNGFEIRNVSYDKVHDIKNKDWEVFIDFIDPKPGERILDAMCGYGDVATHILEKGSDVEFSS